MEIRGSGEAGRTQAAGGAAAGPPPGVNERGWAGCAEAAVIELLCECADPSCDETVLLLCDEYEFIHRVPIRLVVRPDHVQLDSERVVIEEPGRFAVVEKFGPAREVVAHLDPRGRLQREVVSGDSSDPHA